MPLFKEDPAHLSKSRLKSDLVAHNVALPPAKSKKDVYVELHLKHVDQRNAADFSSDEEDEQVNDVADNEEDPNDAEVPDLSTWTDDDLKDALLQHGIKAGPIVATTRALYEKRLRKVLQSNGHKHLNGGEKDSVVYSDSEEEEEGSEEIKEKTGEQVDQNQEESSQLPTEPVKDDLKELLPDVQATPTGIYATCRRPIKGAAGRPIQFVHPDTPLSPVTLERREVERRLVPIHIQIVFFLVVVVLLYLINMWVEESSFDPFVALLDLLNQGLESPLLQTETKETLELSAQE